MNYRVLAGLVRGITPVVNFGHNFVGGRGLGWVSKLALFARGKNYPLDGRAGSRIVRGLGGHVVGGVGLVTSQHVATHNVAMPTTEFMPEEFFKLLYSRPLENTMTSPEKCSLLPVYL